MEVDNIITGEKINDVIVLALTKYDSTGDFWFGYSDEVDINVYVDDGGLWVVAYPYRNGNGWGDEFQTLLKVTL